jgi:hypothetical protein
MSPSNKSWRIVLVLATALLASGCDSEAKVVPVYGVVSLDGEPVNGVAVTFYPAAGGISSVAVSDISGRFSLRTQDDRIGAVVGMHKVAVTHPQDQATTPADARGAPGNPAESAEQHRIVPVRYNSLNDSGLTVNVRPGLEPVMLQLQR